MKFAIAAATLALAWLGLALATPEASAQYTPDPACTAPVIIVTGVTHDDCDGSDGNPGVCQGAQCECWDPSNYHPSGCSGGNAEGGCAAPVIVAVGDDECSGGDGADGTGVAPGGDAGFGCEAIAGVALMGACQSGNPGSCEADNPDCQGDGAQACAAQTAQIALFGSCHGTAGGCEGEVVIYDDSSCKKCEPDEDGGGSQCTEDCNGSYCTRICVETCINYASKGEVEKATESAMGW